MKKVILFLLIGFLLIITPLVGADFGPKESLTINFTNYSDSMYVTIISNNVYYGPHIPINEDGSEVTSVIHDAFMRHESITITECKAKTDYVLVKLAFVFDLNFVKSFEIVDREKLLDECPYCPITMVNDERLLIASHIKPWAKSTNFEKTDPKNGFMLTPTYDKLFDRGFISFENDGTMLVSPWISPMNQKRLDIFNGKKIRMLPTEGREAYLYYHRELVFKK